MATLTTVIVSAIVITAAFLLGSAWLLVRGVRRLAARVSTRVATALGHHVPTVPTAALRPSRLHISAPSGLTRRQAVTVQSWLPGRSREVAGLRRDLNRDLRGAAQAVAVGLEAGRPVQPLAAITARLQRSAGDIDVDLTVIAAEPDVTRRRTLLAEQYERIQAVRRACEQVRRGVLLAGSVTSGPLLPVVVDDLNDEVIRLGLWAKAHHELHNH